MKQFKLNKIVCLYVSILLLSISVIAYGTWDLTKPSDTDLVSIFPSQMRADKTTIQNALNSEHNFNSSTQLGEHKQGSARAFYGSDSNKNSIYSLPADTVTTLSYPMTGSLYYAKDTNILYVGSDDSTSVWVPITPNTACVSQQWASSPLTSTVSNSGWSTWNASLATDIFSNPVSITCAANESLDIDCTVTAHNGTTALNTGCVFFNITVDGTAVTTSHNGLGGVWSPFGVTSYGPNRGTFSCDRIYPIQGVQSALTAGSHVVQVQMCVDSGTATLETNTADTITVKVLP